MSAFATEKFLPICRGASRKEVGPCWERKVTRLVSEAIKSFTDDWPAYFEQQDDRLSRIIHHLDSALAAMLATYRFAEDDEFAPFQDEASALSWLEGNGGNPNAGKPEDFIARRSEWALRNVWLAKVEAVEELMNLYAWDENRDDVARIPKLQTRSYLDLPLQQLITQLCWIWRDHVDEALGLPRRDPNPDNPLLRYLDAVLEIAMGERRPAKKTLLTFVADWVKPAIRRAAAEYEQEREQEISYRTRSFLDVEFDPF
jgi:hypothetical protein